MFFSYNWLQTFFAEKLPAPEILVDKITFYSCEIDEIKKVCDDTVFDIKILPDKSAWLLSHRGVAKEVSVILNLPIKNDPLASELKKLPATDVVEVTSESATCDYYSVARISGVKVGESPVWLKSRLEAIGQRSINNIVDATNYVMFLLGQPLHAFDASKLTEKDGVHRIVVRSANNGELFTSLTSEEYLLTNEDAVITDGFNDRVLALAGVKGGLGSGVDAFTTEIILESAHFDRTAVRKTARRHKLQTDASKRYENGISRTLAQYGLLAGSKLITEIAGGEIVGVASAGDATVTKRDKVTVSLARINSVLGLTLKEEDVKEIVNRFGYEAEVVAGELVVTPPFERDDLVIAEDIIEEIGRVYGLEHIVSIPPVEQSVAEYNARYYYAEKIRQGLVNLGFSEVYTSSFREKDTVKIENALASDKGYLRSTLVENLKEARERNISHRDLLGLLAVKIFEIGSVFDVKSEEFRVAMAVQTGTSYKAKVDDVLLKQALSTVAEALGATPALISQTDGVAEFSLDKLLTELPKVTSYEKIKFTSTVRYQPFSIYPSVSRDIAMWVGEGVEVEEVEAALAATGGDLLVRLTHLDTFTKNGRTSLAFRLVFQALDRTLVEEEIVTVMDKVYEKVKSAGWEVR